MGYYSLGNETNAMTLSLSQHTGKNPTVAKTPSIVRLTLYLEEYGELPLKRLSLLLTKCVPILLYGLEACSIRKMRCCAVLMCP